MTEPPFVQYAVDAGVATLTLDSPHNRNALSGRLLAELLATVHEAVGDPAVRVLVLTHTGPVFCAGVDLKASPDDLPVASLPDVLEALASAPKPVVARVAGPARAGGLGLIGAADLAVTTEDATFAFTEVRLGVVPAVISATVLPRLAPRAAAELFLTGDVFDGRRAAQIGLVTAAVPADELDTAVDRYVAALLRGGPTALAGTKSLLATQPEGPLRQQLDALTALSVTYFTADEGREGVASFREKREPAWVIQRSDPT